METKNPQPTHEKRTRRKEQRPTEIVQAALEVFSEVGFGNAKISDIATRAGAAKGTVYLYFETKEELFEAVVRQFIKPVFAGAQQIAESFPGSATELLTRLIERVYSEMANSPQRRGILRILIAEGGRFPHLAEFYHREIISNVQNLVRGILQRGVDAGEFRPTAVRDFHGVLLGPVMLAAVWKMTFDRFAPLDIESFAQAHIDLILNGLRSNSQKL